MYSSLESLGINETIGNFYLHLITKLPFSTDNLNIHRIIHERVSKEGGIQKVLNPGGLLNQLKQ